MVGNINDRQNDNATTAATPATFGENIAKMQSTTASAPRTVSTFVARTRPITHVMMNREMRKTIRLTCRRKPPSCSDPLQRLLRVLDQVCPRTDLSGDIEELRDDAEHIALVRQQNPQWRFPVEVA